MQLDETMRHVRCNDQHDATKWTNGDLGDVEDATRAKRRQKKEVGGSLDEEWSHHEQRGETIRNAPFNQDTSK